MSTTLDTTNAVNRADFNGRATSIACGAIARVAITVDGEQVIRNATFKVVGCTVLVDALSKLTTGIRDQTTARAASMAEDLNSIERWLTNVTADRNECVMLASEAVLAAIRSYSDSMRNSWEGDDPLICICFGVSEKTIENEIKSKALSSIEEVTKTCNAGAGCRSCYSLIEDILHDVNAR